MTDEQLEAMAEDLTIRSLMDGSEVVVENAPDGLEDMLETDAYHCARFDDGDRQFYFCRNDRYGEQRVGSVVLKAREAEARREGDDG